MVVFITLLPKFAVDLEERADDKQERMQFLWQLIKISKMLIDVLEFYHLKKCFFVSFDFGW